MANQIAEQMAAMDVDSVDQSGPKEYRGCRGRYDDGATGKTVGAQELGRGKGHKFLALAQSTCRAEH
jgi:hypothetical protein